MLYRLGYPFLKCYEAICLFHKYIMTDSCIKSTSKLACMIIGVSLASVAAAFFIESYYSLIPCSLCMLQRACLIVIAISSLLFVISSKISTILQKIFSIVMLIFTLSGMALALRHMYLQAYPGEGLLCMPGGLFLLSEFRVQQFFKWVVASSGHCSTIDWMLFDVFTIPQLSTFVFIILIYFAIRLLKKVFC